MQATVLMLKSSAAGGGGAPSAQGWTAAIGPCQCAGRAVAALWLGQTREALEDVDAVLAYVEAEGLMGLVEPVRMLLNCYEVLAATGYTQRGQLAILRACQWVQTIADRIGDAAVRHSFLNYRPDNVKLQALVATLAV